MRIRHCLFLCVLVAGSFAAGAARAGAFLEPPGHGEVIPSVGFSDSSRYFNANGRLQPITAYRKFELGSYLEYGLTDRVTLVAQPVADIVHQGPSQAVAPFAAGADLGARIGLFDFGSTVISVQASGHLPFGATTMVAGLFDQDRVAAADLRVMIGHSFVLHGMNGFLDVEVSHSFEGSGMPQAWHADATLGLRPQPQLLLMLQSYTTVAGSFGAACPWPSCWSYIKLQPSVVYDLTRQWSVEASVFATVAGQNAGRELGPMAALWYRF